METSNAVIDAVNRFVLKPLGFTRKGMLFNRHRGEFVDVVGFPFNKDRDAVSIEVGVQHDGIYETLWEAPPPRFSNEAACIVHAHLEDLAEGVGHWLPLADPDAALRAVAAVEGPVLRFLQGHHDLPAIDAYLVKALEIERTPRPLLTLAIVRHRRGNAAGAAALLEEVAGGADPDWALRATSVAQRLKSQAEAAAASALPG
jgi:hypothetical protein